MNRRDFIDKARIFSAGTILLPSFLLGCGKDELDSLNLEPEKYIPQVNSQPYFNRKYHIENKTSGSAGTIDALFKNQAYNLFLEDENHNLINGLEGIFYGEEDYGTKIFSISDPQKRYLPNIYSFSNKKGLDVLTMLGLEKGDINSGGIGSFFQGTLIKQIKSGIPSWDLDKMCKYPGMVYLGDWSFNNVKQMNTNLNKTSALITFIAPNPASSAVFGVTSTAGKILSGVDYFLTMVNAFTSLNIDKDKQYPFYQFPGESNQILISLAENFYCLQQPGDINTLFPLFPGNSWIYTDDYGNFYTWEVKGEKDINGKNLLFVKNVDGSEEYFGFKDFTLRQYGIKDPSIGNIFFDPPLTMGDNNIIIGKSYNVSSKIICENYPNITGTVKGSFTCEDRSPIILSNLKPYGDCFKMQEKSNLTVEKEGQANSLNVSATHWFAKNIGKVKTVVNGENFNLMDSNINSKSAKIYTAMPSSFKKLIEQVKAII